MSVTRTARAAALGSFLFCCVSPAAVAVTLTGTIRDFCVPSTATCTRLSDFEGDIPGVVTGMVSSTLTGGLPTPGPNLAAGASNPMNFAKWYVDSPGFNLRQPFSLTLAETAPGSGVFSYSNDAFFPIDGQLFGNQGAPHNYHFTLHLEGVTSFAPTDTFAFTGDDDLWIYIDGKLVMDLGGVHAPASDTITGADLLALGLLPNTPYDLDIFFAERHEVLSSFTVTTSFRIAQVPEPGTLALVVLAWASATLARRRGRRETAG